MANPVHADQQTILRNSNAFSYFKQEDQKSKCKNHLQKKLP